MGWRAVETRCPDCSKRLRLPETYSNQQIHCRNCGSVFRPSEGDLYEPEAVPAAAEADDVAGPRPVARSPKPTVTRSRGGGGGIGMAIIIGIVLSRGIPGVLKMFGNGDRGKPEPVEIRDENFQVLEDALRAAGERPDVVGEGDERERALLDRDKPTREDLDDGPPGGERPESQPR